MLCVIFGGVTVGILELLDRFTLRFLVLLDGFTLDVFSGFGWIYTGCF